ncbi:hypothetical protein MMPV_001116 [Pyropia vietnamensis]
MSPPMVLGDLVDLVDTDSDADAAALPPAAPRPQPHTRCHSLPPSPSPPPLGVRFLSPASPPPVDSAALNSLRRLHPRAPGAVLVAALAAAGGSVGDAEDALDLALDAKTGGYDRSAFGLASDAAAAPNGEPPPRRRRQRRPLPAGVEGGEGDAGGVAARKRARRPRLPDGPDEGDGWEAAGGGIDGDGVGNVNGGRGRNGGGGGGGGAAAPPPPFNHGAAAVARAEATSAARANAAAVKAAAAAEKAAAKAAAAAEKTAAKAAAARVRAAEKAARTAAKEAAATARIEAAYARYHSTSGGGRPVAVAAAVALLLSPSLCSTAAGSALAAGLERQLPRRVGMMPSREALPQSVSWVRSPVATESEGMEAFVVSPLGSGEGAVPPTALVPGVVTLPRVAVVLPAAMAVGLVADVASLDAYAAEMLRAAGTGVRIEVLLLGLSKYCKAAAAAAAAAAATPGSAAARRHHAGNDDDGPPPPLPPLIGRPAVLDAMTYLQIEYGITHTEVPTVAAAVEHLAATTTGIASAPHARPATFLNAVARRAGGLKRNDDRHEVVADGGGREEGEWQPSVSSSRVAFLTAAVGGTGGHGNGSDGGHGGGSGSGNGGSSGGDDGGGQTAAAGGVTIERSGSLGVAYLNLLTRVPSVSPEMAAAVRRAHPTLASLRVALRSRAGVAALARVRVRENRRLGPAIATRLAVVFMCNDPMRRVLAD